MTEPTLLVLGASCYQLEAIHTAKRLGFRVVTLDNVPSNPGHAVADLSYNVDTTDVVSVLEVARRESIDGIIAVATDVAVPTAARVADELKLPGPSVACADTVCDKSSFRESLQFHGLPVPNMVELTPGDPVDEDLFKRGRMIIKPARSSGSKGIRIVSSPGECGRASTEAFAFSRDGRAILEDYIEGYQGTLEGVMIDARVAASFFLDRQVFNPPYVTTVGHRLPTRLSAIDQQRVVDQVVAVWDILGYRDGPFDCDFVVGLEHVFLLEMAPRVGGNSIARLLRSAADFDIVEYAVRLAGGIRPDLAALRDPRPAGLALLGADRPGRLVFDEHAIEELREEPWVEHLELDVEIGEHVQAFINGRHRVGEAMFFGADRDEVDEHAAELLQRLDLRVQRVGEGF